MPIPLSEFADKVQNAPGDHLVQVKDGNAGQPQLAILAVSSQTLGGHVAAHVQFIPPAAAESMRPEDIAYTHAALLHAIDECYRPNTDVSSKIQEKYQLAADGSSDLQTIKPLTCRDVKQILASAEQLAKNAPCSKLPPEMIEEIALHITDRRTLHSMVLSTRWLCRLTAPLHMLEQAKELHTLKLPNDKASKFFDLFRYFTGVDILDRFRLPDEQPPEFLTPPPGEDISSKGVIALTNQIKYLRPAVALDCFEACLARIKSTTGQDLELLIDALAEQVGFSDNTRFFKHVDELRTAVEALPLEKQSARWIKLSAHLQRFNSNDARNFFDRIFSATALSNSKNRGEVLAALTRQLPYITNRWDPALLLDYFDKLFDAIKQLELEDQSAGWAGLASQLSLFAPDQARILFDRIFDATKLLTSKSQGPALGELAQHLRIVSNNGDPALLLSYFDKLFDAIKRLEPEDQSIAWFQLTFKLSLFTPDQARIRFDDILNVTELLTSKHRGGVLMALTSQLGHLAGDREHALLFDCFNKLYEAIERLESEDQDENWARLAKKVSLLTLDQQRVMLGRISENLERIRSRDAGSLP